jgi:aspartate/methionine/tyrosine aminotransferase
MGIDSSEGFGEMVPIPGIKPILLQVIMASRSSPDDLISVMTDTNPGYPTPKVMVDFLSCGHLHLHAKINPSNAFIPQVYDLEKAHGGIEVSDGPGGIDLIMLNRPHNPTGQIMTLEAWHEICEFCEQKGIRLFNDGAYTLLDHSNRYVPLSLVANKYKNLSWGEAFSASKLGNMTGWRVGLMNGSEDFIADFKQIKGDVDSGFCAPMAVGVNALVTHDMSYIYHVRKRYSERLHTLDELLNNAELRQAVPSNSGFFTFWHAPSRAFDQEIENGEHFNKLMIENTGIVGVHFGKFIRYSVATCEFNSQEQGRIADSFIKAGIQT